jgi:putative DNA methylase
MNQRKKLIEVALPLEAINIASAREKSIRHGHPSTLHLWWARRPLAAARAVIFSQMVDDPSEYVQELINQGTDSRRAADRELRKQLAAWRELPEEARDGRTQPTLEEVAIEIERQRLFALIEELVQWENTTNEEVLQKARDEIWRSWRRTCAQNAGHPQAKELFDRDKLPGFHDPFAGGGALPLEAQRLGLEAYATDLNPVAVLINKAMIEIPPKFANQPPVNPAAQAKKHLSTWKGAQGLAEDVRYYGQWMRDEAEKRIGALYSTVEVTSDMAFERPDLRPYVGRKLTVIAWVWARTVKSPNPAFRSVDVPLTTTFMLGTKLGKEVHIEPLISGSGYRFVVKRAKPDDAASAKRGTKSASSGSSFLCLMSGAPMPFEYLRAEAKAGRMGARLMAVVAEGDRGRVYLSPTKDMEDLAASVVPVDAPEAYLPAKALGFRIQEYGMTRWRDLFTSRQLVALETMSHIVQEARETVARDATNAHPNPSEYADAVASYLGLAVGRLSDYCSTICTWANNPQMEIVRGTFARQALPMTWDFAETNPFGPSTGSLEIVLGWIAKVIERLPARPPGTSQQQDARIQPDAPTGTIISTDPPYYDNIGYADLSDFFYVWLRKAIKPVYPSLFATLAVPKVEELIATPFRHDSKQKAEAFFLSGMPKR